MKRLFGLATALVLLATPVSAVGFRTGQVNCTGTAAEIGNEADRVGLWLDNTHATVDVYVGKSTVATTTGKRVAAGKDATIGTIVNGTSVAVSEIYCVTAGTTAVVTFWETIR